MDMSWSYVNRETGLRNRNSKKISHLTGDSVKTVFRESTKFSERLVTGGTRAGPGEDMGSGRVSGQWLPELQS